MPVSKNTVLQFKNNGNITMELNTWKYNTLEVNIFIHQKITYSLFAGLKDLSFTEKQPREVFCKKGCS